MLDDEKRVLSRRRLENALECLDIGIQVIELGHYKTAANRLYYAAFHAMRAMLALDGIDMKHHSGIISEFRRLYIKTGIFENRMSEITAHPMGSHRVRILHLFYQRKNCVLLFLIEPAPTFDKPPLTVCQRDCLFPIGKKLGKRDTVCCTYLFQRGQRGNKPLAIP